MHAEVVNGMDVLAVRDAVLRGAKLCREGKGPVLIEADCYRYWGHSLSDPRNEYRTKEEEAAWKAVDPIEAYKKELIAAGVLDAEGIEEVTRRVAERNARAAKRAADAADPDVKDVLAFMYTDTKSETVPPQFAKVETYAPTPESKRVNGEITYKDAIREALAEEMLRDNRVVLLRRGRGRLRRRVQGDEGPARGLRPPSRLQHADQRGLHLRHRRAARRCGACGRSSS